MPEETGALLKLFASVKKCACGIRSAYRCDHSGHEIVLCEAGMGFDNAARAAEAMVNEFSPGMLISSGFCGGITPELTVGDVVVAMAVIIASGTETEKVPVEIPEQCSNFVTRQTAEGKRVFGGLFVSTPVIVQKQRMAAMMPPGTRYPVLEMESAAIAIVAVENGIPFAGIRAVSDPFDEELGFSLDEFCDRQMRIRIPRVLSTILRKPRIIPQLIRLARNSRVAGAGMARAVECFLASV
jgi:adenosylhomocysteine nucleosidase